METVILVIEAIVLVAVVGYLVGSMLRHIRTEKRQANLKRTFANFGLSIALCILFLVSWAGQALSQWESFKADQREHGEPVEVTEFFHEFSEATLENWQSEFLQLFSFVVLAALLLHHGSAESKDSDDRIEAALTRIENRLQELDINGS
jgi:succinate dehydrogenase hydrophobic anchor subunit